MVGRDRRLYIDGGIEMRTMFAALLLAAFATTAHAQTTITVPNGGDFQAALAKAAPGDTIVLETGATFTGNFTLPPKVLGTPVITIKSSGTLPDRRMTAADVSLMATIQPTGVEPAVLCEGSNGWKFDGVHIGSNTLGLYDAVRTHNCDSITFDRLIIIGGTNGQKRGIAGHGTRITLTRSHIANIWSADQDSQAFCAWDGAGPYTLTDNYLEAAGENVMFGGAASSDATRIPADILVEGNHLFKPLTWKGQPRSVKNLFELKAAKRAIIRRNTFENNWTSAQNGYAILFTVRNDDGNCQLHPGEPCSNKLGAPWTVVEDITFEYNIVKGTENGINILGRDSYGASGQTTRVTIRHNLILATGTLFQVGGEVGVLTIDHVTADQGWTFMQLYKGAVWPNTEAKARPTKYAVEDLTVTNTLANHNEYGLIGEEAGIGTPALTADIDPQTAGVQPHALKWTWTNNVLSGDNPHPYPPVTWKPSVLEYKAQFNADYTLKATSTYKSKATDGSDLGALLDQPAPVDPCVETPFKVTNITWPVNYAGGTKRLFGFTANRAWRSAMFTAPGVLKVVAVDGCEALIIKPGVKP